MNGCYRFLTLGEDMSPLSICSNLKLYNWMFGLEAMLHEKVSIVQLVLLNPSFGFELVYMKLT